MTLIYYITKPKGAFWLNVGYLEVDGKGLCVPIPYLLWNKSPFYFIQKKGHGSSRHARERNHHTLQVGYDVSAVRSVTDSL